MVTAQLIPTTQAHTAYKGAEPDVEIISPFMLEKFLKKLKVDENVSESVSSKAEGYFYSLELFKLFEPL